MNDGIGNSVFHYHNTSAHLIPVYSFPASLDRACVTQQWLSKQFLKYLPAKYLDQLDKTIKQKHWALTAETTQQYERLRGLSILVKAAMYTDRLHVRVSVCSADV